MLWMLDAYRMNSELILHHKAKQRKDPWPLSTVKLRPLLPRSCLSHTVCSYVCAYVSVHRCIICHVYIICLHTCFTMCGALLIVEAFLSPWSCAATLRKQQGALSRGNPYIVLSPVWLTLTVPPEEAATCLWLAIKHLVCKLKPCRMSYTSGARPLFYCQTPIHITSAEKTVQREISIGSGSWAEEEVANQGPASRADSVLYCHWQRLICCTALVPYASAAVDLNVRFEMPSL